MEFGQLSSMLATLREMFDENPNGMTIDAELSRMLGGGLRDMHCAALKLEQWVLQHVETVHDTAAVGLGRSTRPVPPYIDNVIAFPLPLRPSPIGGGAA